MGIPDHLTCLLRNLYAGQEATVRNGHGFGWTPRVGDGQSRTRLSSFTFSFHFHTLEKEMETHSSVLALRTRTAWWAAVYGVAQSRIQLKQLSSSSSSSNYHNIESTLKVGNMLYTFYKMLSQRYNST